MSDAGGTMSDMTSQRITVRVPATLGTRLRHSSRMQGQTPSDLVRVALENYLGREATVGSAERERNAQHRILHDSALQTLEIVARSASVDDAVRGQARSEAMTLRLALQGEPTADSGGILEGLQQLAIHFARRGLRVEVHDTGLEFRPDQAGVRALCDATREALVNIDRK